VVAFYVNSDNSKESMVKLGSYDPEGFLDSDNYQLLNTTTTNSWAVSSYESGFTDDTGFFQFITEDREVIIEPAYPFIYVPTNTYNLLAGIIENHLILISMTKTDDYVKFDKSCAAIGAEISEKHGVQSFFVRFKGGHFTPKISLQDLLVEPSFLNPKFTGQESCYLGIFPNTNAKD